MRSLILVLAAATMLAACNDPNTSPANKMPDGSSGNAAAVNNGLGDSSAANEPATSASGGQAPAANAGAARNSAAPARAARAPLDAAQITHERHEGMEAIGKAFKVLRREFASSPSIETVRPAAAKIAALAQRSSGWFPKGTGPEIGKTGAKPEIWDPQNRADFAAKLKTFQHTANGFNAMAKSGDMDGLGAAFADLGGTCKSCHDKYRTEMHH